MVAKAKNLVIDESTVVNAARRVAKMVGRKMPNHYDDAFSEALYRLYVNRWGQPYWSSVNYTVTDVHRELAKYIHQSTRPETRKDPSSYPKCFTETDSTKAHKPDRQWMEDHNRFKVNPGIENIIEKYGIKGRDADILRMRYVDDYTMLEIGNALGCTLSNVSLIHGKILQTIRNKQVA